VGSRSDAGIRVLVVDDHEVFGASLARSLGDEPDLEVVGAVTSAPAAMTALEKVGADVVLSDFRLADDDGVSLTRQIADRWPDVAVVMLTASNDEAVLSAALEAGCAGFVTKAESLETVIAAVRAAAVGEAVITPALLARLLPRLSSRPRGRNPDLTPREREVLTLIVEGGTNQEIADRLVLSRDTVRNHVSSILSKLGVHSKLQAAAAATQRGLVIIDNS
jgi:DNA-binding NarL/FixJ family response regulator